MAEILVPTGRGKPDVPLVDATPKQLRSFLEWYDKNPKAPAAMKRADVAVMCRARLVELTADGTVPPDAAPTQASAPPAAKARGNPARDKSVPARDNTDPARDDPARDDSTALAKVDPGLAGLQRVRDLPTINKRLADLAKRMHLVTPATEIEHVPEGFGISVSMVKVDKNASPAGPGEVYKVGNKVGLAKAPLERIWAAAGGDWIPHLTGRIDNGRDPRYWRYRATGVIKNTDGTPRHLVGEVELDARDGSDLINEIVEKALKREKDPDYSGKRDGGAAQVLELRKFLSRHAESKAKNRAIASMGVKRSYHPAELDKPFAVVRLVFTGHSEDPVLKEKLALMNAQAALHGTYALYGGAPPPMALPSGGGYEPPPVGSTGEGVGADEIPDGDFEAPDSERAESDLGLDDDEVQT